MANNITLFTQCTTQLDEVYTLSSLTAVLDGANDLVQAGANANEIIIPKMEMDGLGDYDKSEGYPHGDVTLTNETVKCNFDRGRMFSVDNMDNAETAGVAFGRLSGEFIRTKVVPELDAFRLSKYAQKAYIAMESDPLTSGEAVVKAIRNITTSMDNAEVPVEGRYLFILPELHDAILDLDTTKSKAVLNQFAGVVRVPQKRFYTEIAQTENGYVKADEAKEIAFLVVCKDAVIQFQKHVAPKVVTPEVNPDADAWKFGYRNVGIADVYENKTAGLGVYTFDAAAEASTEE